MSYRFQSQPSKNFSLVVFEGKISPAEEAQALNDFAMQPDIDLSLDILVDRSGATMTVRASDVQPQLELAKRSFNLPDSRPRMAIVAPEEVDFGMSRMLQLNAGDKGPHEIMVFRDLDSACLWLKIAEDEIVWP